MRCPSVPGLIAVGDCAFDGGRLDRKRILPVGRRRCPDIPTSGSWSGTVATGRWRRSSTKVYDVRKGQYTPAVDAWIRALRTKYPAYDITSREVDLAREQGETESLKVGSVIKRELYGRRSSRGHRDR